MFKQYSMVNIIFYFLHEHEHEHFLRQIYMNAKTWTSVWTTHLDRLLEHHTCLHEHIILNTFLNNPSIGDVLLCATRQHLIQLLLEYNILNTYLNTMSWTRSYTWIPHLKLLLEYNHVNHTIFNTYLNTTSCTSVSTTPTLCRKTLMMLAWRWTAFPSPPPPPCREKLRWI